MVKIAKLPSDNSKVRLEIWINYEVNHFNKASIEEKDKSLKSKSKF